MLVKINDYYSHEIDKLKEGFIKDDYSLKSKYFFVGTYILMVFGDFIILPKDISIVTVMMYAFPLIVGIFIEIYEIKKYDVLDLGLEKIQKLLCISVVRMINIYLSLLSAILILGKDIFEIILYENNHIIDLNTMLVMLIMLLFIFFIIAFLIGIKVERKDIIGNKRKKYVPIAVLGASITLGILLFRHVSYSYLVIICIFTEIIFGYGIGKIYFRYKNFDKKVIDSNKIVDYKL